MTHTKGPWSVGLKSKFETLNPNFIYAENGDSICSLFEVPMHTSLEELQRSGNHHDSVGLANARLIAAAPDLLAALQALYDAMPVGYGNDSALEVALKQAEDLLERVEEK
jgi:hypothetical protein